MTGWSGPPLVGRRLVVIAPHPDDEVLCAGGLMRWTAGHGGQVVVVAVTDGEASHARSTLVTPSELRDRRAGERLEALDRMGVLRAEIIRLGIPDQGCDPCREQIATALGAVLRDGDVVVGPSSGDRHPDHVAVADAVGLAAARSVGSWWEAPTWALVHGSASPPGTTLALDGRAWAAKQHAVAAYRSQLTPLGPDPVDGPVVHPDELAAMLRPAEQFAMAGPAVR